MTRTRSEHLNRRIPRTGDAIFGDKEPLPSQPQYLDGSNQTRSSDLANSENRGTHGHMAWRERPAG